MTRKVHLVLGSIVCLLSISSRTADAGRDGRDRIQRNASRERVVQSDCHAVAPDGRLFVAEQGGRLRVIKAGVCCRRAS